MFLKNYQDQTDKRAIAEIRVAEEKARQELTSVKERLQQYEKVAKIDQVKAMEEKHSEELNSIKKVLFSL